MSVKYRPLFLHHTISWRWTVKHSIFGRIMFLCFLPILTVSWAYGFAVVQFLVGLIIIFLICMVLIIYRNSPSYVEMHRFRNNNCVWSKYLFTALLREEKTANCTLNVYVIFIIKLQKYRINQLYYKNVNTFKEENIPINFWLYYVFCFTFYLN